MEQRPLRLGDIVDDYCPRERRLTNHAIVALVEQTVKQTRCTTCDHEHVYKHAREPRRRKKDDTSALYSQVLSGLQKPAGQPFPEETDTVDEREDPAEPAEADETLTAAAVAEDLPQEAASASDEDQGAEALDANGNGDKSQPGDDEPWPTHRRLIRAQLPRTGNEPPPARPLPDFTVRQPGARGGQQRQWGRGGATGGANGNHGRGGQGQGHGGGQPRTGRGRGFAPPRPEGRGGPGGGRPGGGRGRRSR